MGGQNGSHVPRLYPSRENVLRNLVDKAFDRPICEALLDQRFFNGIGNYLRAEILYRSAGRPWAKGRGWTGCVHIPHCLAWLSPPHCRLKIPPFEKARTVLEALQQRRPVRMQGGRHAPISEDQQRVWGWVRCLQCNSSPFWALGLFPLLYNVLRDGGGADNHLSSPDKLRICSLGVQLPSEWPCLRPFSRAQS